MAQYGKSWGSVSTNFTRTTGFTSETKRLSQAAEDQYRKEKDQLSSMKETAAFDSRQMRSSAAFADKATQYELKALSKFSNKLNTFLQGTAAEWHKEEKAKDIKKKITEFKTNRTKWNEKKVELEDLIKKSAGNDQKVQELEQKLKDHNLLDPNDPNNIKKLSGNEKIAYYSVTAAQQVENTEGKYYNWVEENGETEVEATWLPEEEYKDELGNTKKRHPRRKINQITELAGKQFLKDKFLAEQLEANPMGGLKEDYRVLLFGEPMQSALDKIQATETTNYRQDAAGQKWDSDLQKVTNRISGVPPYDNESDIGEEFNAVLAGTGTTYVATGKGSRQQGIDSLFTALQASVTSQTDPDKMHEAHQRLLALGGKKVTTGPCSVKGLTVKQCFEKSGRWDETKMTKAYHKALGEIDTKQAIQVRGQVKSDFQTIENDLSAKAAKEKDAFTPAQRKAFAEERINALEDKYRNNPVALAQIAELRGTATIGFTEQDWRDKFIDLGATHRGVVPKKELAGMPEALVNQFSKEYGWRVVTNVPGRETKENAAISDSYIGKNGTLSQAIREVEKLNHQPNANTDTAVMIDFAGDKFQQLVNQYTSTGDENGRVLSPRAAMEKANMQILSMIRNPNENLDDGTPNPFYASISTSDVGKNNAWHNNKFTDRHQLRGQRLFGKNEEASAQQILYPAQEKINTITNRGDKVQPSKDYLLPELPIDKETKQITDMSSLDILSDPPDPKVLFAYNRLSRHGAKNFGDFVHKQRIAILKKTSPSGHAEQSTLFADNPDLMLKWFPPDSAMRTKRQGEEAYTKAENAPGFQEDASGVRADYGNEAGLFGWRKGPSLTDQQARDYTSGRGIEWTTDD